MFLLNSRLDHFSAAQHSTLITSLALLLYIMARVECWAPLLPKLRGYFAEFLNEGFLARLRILTPSTCVGLRYGHLVTH